MPDRNLDPSLSEKIILLERKNNIKSYLLFIFVIFGIFAVSIGFMLYGLRESINFYKTPSEVTSEDIGASKQFRLSGFVVKNSFKVLPSKAKNPIFSFDLSDAQHKIHVSYQGVLPNLFREGQQIIAEGYFQDKMHFIAKKILAKHDETYYPVNTVTIKE